MIECSMLANNEAALLLLFLPKSTHVAVAESRLKSVLKNNLQIQADNNELFTYFLSLSALHLHSAEGIDGISLAQATALLVKNEIAVGGPYSDLHGVTEDTNSMIEFFLSQLDIPHASNLLSKYEFKDSYNHVNKDFTDYLKHTVLAAKSYKLSKKDGWSFEKLLHTISCAAAKNVSRADLDLLYSAITAKLQKRSPLFKEILFATAGCTVLSIYEKPQKSSDNTLAKLSQSIYKQVLKDMHMADSELNERIQGAIKTVQTVDQAYEISLISYLFRTQTSNTVIQDSDYITLGKANVCLWAAYTIYDDIMDGESVVEDLPTANIFMRRSLYYFRTCFPDLTSANLVEEFFTKMDGANSWELQNCRAAVRGNNIIFSSFPDYKDLHVIADRACAHILGPLLVHKNVRKNSEISLQHSLYNYLIAKQIEDDIHDWQQDFARGHISWVVLYLLTKLQISPGSYNQNKLLLKMKEYYWNQGCFELLKIQASYIDKSKTYLVSVGNTYNSLKTNTLLDQLGSSNEKSVKQLRMHYDFVTSFKQYFTVE